jgi:hypothetical protein
MEIPNNDLLSFITAASNQMDEEYFRIQRRVREDPGTAGDQGEENWATLLRNWLPPTFQIVTKGRILNSKGFASPQIDIIVLKPEYPRGLLDKKVYLEGGVLAVFECKLTLKSIDIAKFFKNSVIIKKMQSPIFPQSIYNETHTRIYYGLLSHSHNWAKSAKMLKTISSKIHENDLRLITHPIQMPDIICIADTGCWVASKSLVPQIDLSKKPYKNSSIFTYYLCEQLEENKNKPIGTALRNILHRLSKEHDGLRSLAEYFNRTIQKTGGGTIRYWDIAKIFSEKSQSELGKIGKHPDYYFPEDYKFL